SYPSRLSSWLSTSRVGASSSIIRTRAMVHLSYTACRTILCRITIPKQSKNDAKCASTESMKHIKGDITGRPSFCQVLCTRFPEKWAHDRPRKDRVLSYPAKRMRVWGARMRVQQGKRAAR